MAGTAQGGRTGLESPLERFEPISLEQLDAIRLMNRVDTKYVTTAEDLARLLEAAAPHYYALETETGKVTPYDTLYFDTPDLAMYLMHHNRRLHRVKVRVRRYGNSGLTFLEVKRKDNHGRTKKKRMPVEGFSLDAGAEDFLMARSGYRPEELAPALETTFRRITLTDKEMTERITIDTDLRFDNLRTHLSGGLGDLAVIELKQDAFTPSRMSAILRELHIRPLRVSKYCIGTALTAPAVKQNNFKLKLRQLNKLSHASASTPGL